MDFLLLLSSNYLHDTIDWRNSMDERTWVSLAIGGDEGAFVKLYERYYMKLYKYAVYTLRTVQDAEDAVCETMAEAYAGIGKLRNPESFGTWLFRILSNKCKKRMRDYYVIMEEAAGEEVAVHMDLALNLQVKQLFASLPKRERQVVGLSVFGGYDSREIGEILKMNANTVRSIRKRALDKMAKEIGN